MPSFQPSTGWRTFESKTDIGSEPAPVAWAANVQFEAERVDRGLPENTVRKLPAGGIVISALGPRRFVGDVPFPDSSVPLEVSLEGCVSSYEGQSNPLVTLCPLDRRVGSNEVLNVMVWLGADAPAAKPSQRLLDLANEQLSRFTID
jgi:hypothetical protein